jgi:hypothetical protein
MVAMSANYWELKQIKTFASNSERKFVVSELDLTGSRDVLGQPDDGNVVVDIEIVVVLVDGGVAAFDDDAAGFGLVTEVQGTSVDFPGAVPEIFIVLVKKHANFAGAFIIPIDAMCGGEDDVVGDQGAAAEADAVADQRHLILELAGGGQIAADNAVTVADFLVGTRGLGPGQGPHVGPVGGLLFWRGRTF